MRVELWLTKQILSVVFHLITWSVLACAACRAWPSRWPGWRWAHCRTWWSYQPSWAWPQPLWRFRLSSNSQCCSLSPPLYLTSFYLLDIHFQSLLYEVHSVTLLAILCTSCKYFISENFQKLYWELLSLSWRRAWTPAWLPCPPMPAWKWTTWPPSWWPCSDPSSWAGTVKQPRGQGTILALIISASVRAYTLHLLTLNPCTSCRYFISENIDFYVFPWLKRRYRVNKAL